MILSNFLFEAEAQEGFRPVNQCWAMNENASGELPERLVPNVKLGTTFHCLRWKNKPPFRLCLNRAAADEIIWHAKHYTGRGVTWLDHGSGAGPIDTIAYSPLFFSAWEDIFLT